MYALIQGTTQDLFYRAHIIENQRGVYQWKYDHEGKDKLGVPFANLDDAVSVLRETRLKWGNPKTKMLVIEGRTVRLTMNDIDYKEPEGSEKIVED